MDNFLMLLVTPGAAAYASGLYQDAGQFPTGRCVRKTMKMPAFSQFYQIHIEFKILKAVCVCVCVHAHVHKYVCLTRKG